MWEKDVAARFIARPFDEHRFAAIRRNKLRRNGTV